jgi:hypothetical protein
VEPFKTYASEGLREGGETWDSRGGDIAMTQEKGQEERRIWGKYGELLSEE